MRLYIACLASYNNGVLYGKWIDASSDVEEMQEEISTILRGSPYPNAKVTCPQCDDCPMESLGCGTCHGTGKVPSAEEWAVHDYEDFPNMGEYPDLKEVAAFAELVDEMDGQHTQEAIQAVVDEVHGDLESAKDMLEEKYCGTYDSFREYAEEVADELIESLGKGANETLTNYFDYDSYARDLKMDMITIDISGGVMIFLA